MHLNTHSGTSPPPVSPCTQVPQNPSFHAPHHTPRHLTTHLTTHTGTSPPISLHTQARHHPSLHTPRHFCHNQNTPAIASAGLISRARAQDHSLCWTLRPSETQYMCINNYYSILYYLIYPKLHECVTFSTDLSIRLNNAII